MTDVAAAAERLVQAYNAKDFDTLERLIAPNIDFAHFNRNFNLSDRGALLDVLRSFATSYVPDRRFEPPERVQTFGDTVVREAWYAGTAAVDLPGFGAAGEKFRLKFCSVMRFDASGVLVEWKDYG